MSTTITTQEARALGGIARQMRALFSGIDRLPEAFEAAEALEARLATAHEQLRVLDIATARASADRAEAESQIQAARKRMEAAVAAAKVEERKLATLAAKRGKIEQVEQLDEEIAALTAHKATLTEDMERLRLKFTA